MKEIEQRELVRKPPQCRPHLSNSAKLLSG
jgi:hypothetical protein